MENVTYFENEILVLDVKKLVYKINNIEIRLSKKQTKLIDFLIKGINQKEEIISLMWNENANKSVVNSYNQLVYQTRSLLIDNGLPDDFIITIPRYGLCINKNYIDRNLANKNFLTKMYSDHSCLF